METKPNRVHRTAYVTLTALLCVDLAVSGAAALFQAPAIVAIARHVGYPAYLATILGTWKLLAVPAIATSRYPRLQEWAYAGVFFELTGAAASHLAVHDPVTAVLPPLGILAVALASWALRIARHEKLPRPELRLAALAAGSSSLALAATIAADGSLPRFAPRTPSNTSSTASEADDVVSFWRSAGPNMWFAKDPAFDRRFRDRFLRLHEAAARGELDRWLATPNGALALIILLDQFPRNAFRGTPCMYATDERARTAAAAAIRAGVDQAIDPSLRLFVYLPFGHSESLADQERSVALARTLGDSSRARHHYDIIERFGRFPHRNAILGRATTAEEQAYLDNGGYAG